MSWNSSDANVVFIYNCLPNLPTITLTSLFIYNVSTKHGIRTNTSHVVCVKYVAIQRRVCIHLQCVLKSVDIKHRVCIDYYLTAVHWTKWNRYVRTNAKTTVLGGSLRDKVICKVTTALIARITGPTLGSSGADRTQVGPVLAAWTLLSGVL